MGGLLDLVIYVLLGKFEFVYSNEDGNCCDDEYHVYYHELIYQRIYY